MRKRKLPTSKKHLRTTGDQLFILACIKKWGNKDEIDGEQASDVHHFYPRNSYGHLRYEINNGIILSRKNHFKHHFKGDPAIHQAIIVKRGLKWHKALEKKAQERPQSFQIVKWYLEQIKQLKDYLENKSEPPENGI